ncbi:unnamed protein product [Malus baccata var. baccata]
MWKGLQPRPVFGESNAGGWWSIDEDSRCIVNPGIYRINFNTGKYSTGGFFPYVSIVFEIGESQKLEHFHVPLLLSPFSFSTYRGS